MIRCRFVVLAVWLSVMPASVSAAEAGNTDDRLAIKGYDPVAYFTEGHPAAGDPRFEYEWDGAIYRFASPRHRDLFRADPERYAPQYGNLCTTSLARGKRVTADPNVWIIHRSRLYLFSRSSGPRRMRADPERIKANADANYARAATLPRESLPPPNAEPSDAQDDDM